MPTLKVDGKTVEAPAGVPIIEAAKLAGIEVPYFCYHEKLSRPANCRQCLVEVAKAPKLVPACYTTVSEGMEVFTESARVKEVQRTNMEFLLLNHPVDCPICDQAGECKLQDYYRDYDFKPSRLNILPNHKPKVVRLGAQVVLDAERCILCTRCVRFYEEIVSSENAVGAKKKHQTAPQTAAPSQRPLGVFKRGSKSELGLYPGEELPHGYARNVVDICPVGALTSEEFRFRKRVWFLRRTESICTGCATGCNIHLEHHEGVAYRYKPRDNEAVNECWVCDDGAYSYTRINEQRLTAPKVRQGDVFAEVTWADAIGAAAAALNAQDNGRPVGVVLSAQASVEDNWAFTRLAREVLGEPRFYLGGKAPWQGDKVLKSDDQNPNTLGVKLIGGKVLLGLDALIADLKGQKLRAVLVVGGDLADPKAYEALRSAPAVVLVATNETPALQSATVLLPGVTHAEKEGVFVNGDGRAQHFFQAFDPKGRAAPEWKIALKLGERLGRDFGWTGPQSIFDDLAAQVPAFMGQSYQTIGNGGALLDGFKPAEPSAPAASPAP